MAALSLGLIRAVEALEPLQSHEPYLKWSVSTGLAFLGDASSIPDILEWIGDGNRMTRQAAIQSIAEFRDPITILPLVEQLRRESNRDSRAIIIDSLGRIAEKEGGLTTLRRIRHNVSWVAALRFPSLYRLLKLE